MSIIFWFSRCSNGGFAFDAVGSGYWKYVTRINRIHAMYIETQTTTQTTINDEIRDEFSELLKILCLRFHFKSNNQYESMLEFFRLPLGVSLVGWIAIPRSDNSKMSHRTGENSIKHKVECR